jgi:hypothetical protein
MKDGTSFVKPSLDFNADVATTSPRIEIVRNNQLFMIRLQYDSKGVCVFFS